MDGLAEENLLVQDVRLARLISPQGSMLPKMGFDFG